MRCKACNKKLSERRVREVIAKRGRDERRSHHNIYCDNKCYREHTTAKSKGSRTCPSCGQRKSRDSARCQVCKNLAVFEHMFDSDVLKLVLMNPGCGYQYFVDQVSQIVGKGGSTDSKYRLRQFLEDMSEHDGVDYEAWINSPDAMIVVKQDEVPDDRVKYIGQQRRSTVASYTQRRDLREGKIDEIKIHNRVRIPREFKWGDVKPIDRG